MCIIATMVDYWHTQYEKHVKNQQITNQKQLELKYIEPQNQPTIDSSIINIRGKTHNMCNYISVCAVENSTIPIICLETDRSNNYIQYETHKEKNYELSRILRAMSYCNCKFHIILFVF